MDAIDLLKTLAAHGVTLQVKPGGGLSANGDPAIIAQHREAICEHKTGLLAILTGEACPAALAVECWTPAGGVVIAQARDQAHAEQLRQWNPRPAPAAASIGDMKRAVVESLPTLQEIAER